jgi:hypothetical protein
VHAEKAVLDLYVITIHVTPVTSAMSHKLGEEKRPTDLVHYHFVCKVKFVMSGCRFCWGGRFLKLMANFGQRSFLRETDDTHDSTHHSQMSRSGHHHARALLFGIR